MYIIPCASQNTDAITLPADFCAFGRFGRGLRLLSTQLTADLTLVCSGGSMFWSLSHIDEKNPFYFDETGSNSSRNHRHVVVFGPL